MDTVEERNVDVDVDAYSCLSKVSEVDQCNGRMREGGAQSSDNTETIETFPSRKDNQLCHHNTTRTLFKVPKTPMVLRFFIVLFSNT